MPASEQAHARSNAPSTDWESAPAMLRLKKSCGDSHPRAILRPFNQYQHHQLYPTSRMVSNYTGMAVQPTKRLSRNAFAHSGHPPGWHIKEPPDLRNYGCQNGWRIGLVCWASTETCLADRLEQMGYVLDNDQLNRHLRFKEIADKKSMWLRRISKDYL